MADNQSQADKGETEAYDNVIRHIPGLNMIYSPLRAVVYAGKGDDEQTMNSVIGIASSTIGTAVAAIPVPGLGVTAGAIAAGAAGALTEYGATKGTEALTAGMKKCKLFMRPVQDFFRLE